MNFYKLSGGDKIKVAFAKGNDWDQIICPVSEAHARPGERLTELRIMLPFSEVPHFMRTSLSDLIITDEVAQLFEEAGFIGYLLKPVTVVKVRKGNKKDVPVLWELVAIGDGGEVQLKSWITTRYECPACGLKRYTDITHGLFVDEYQWDGSDFIKVLPVPKYIIVTERVKDFIEQRKFTNYKLIPTEKIRGRIEDEGIDPG
jgi:hypothetical protein